MRLSDRLALVTGGSRGLGFAITRRLATDGAQIVVADRVDCRDRVRELPAELQERIAYHETDVGSDDSVRRLVDTLPSRLGDRSLVLVNNAAVFTSIERTSLEEIDVAEWEQVLAVNVIGVFRCIKAVVPVMRGRSYGKVINVASNVAFKGVGGLLHYVASKGAVVALTRAASKELGLHHITVNAVAPGYLRHDDFGGWDEARDAQVRRLRSLDRSQVPDDVVGTVAFLASSDSDFLTGQTIVVDGGEVFH
jgi:NAD(P)-dependent dehydrogenase (short-subunit alcohol dehydrogenase family)